METMRDRDKAPMDAGPNHERGADQVARSPPVGRRKVWRRLVRRAAAAAVTSGSAPVEVASSRSKSSISDQQPVGRTVAISPAQESPAATGHSGAQQTQQPLIHTDHLNTTTRLLYISRAAKQQHHQHAAATFKRRAGRLLEMAPLEGAEESRVQLARVPLPAPKLEILALEVASDTATLTWSLTWTPRSAQTAIRSRRDTTQVRPGNQEEGEEDEEEAAAADVEEPKRRRINKRRRMKKIREHDEQDGREPEESQRLASATKSSTTTSTSERPNEEFALEDEQLRDETAASQEHKGDILRHNGAPTRMRNSTNSSSSSSSNKSNSSTTLRPVPPSSGPARRPPNRQQQAASNMTNLIVSKQGHSQTTNMTASASKAPASDQHKTGNRSTAMRTSAQPRLPASSTTPASSANVGRISEEPPMVRLPAVPMNRISNQTSTNAARLARARAKSMKLEESTPDGQTQAAMPPAPSGDKEASESTLKSISQADASANSTTATSLSASTNTSASSVISSPGSQSTRLPPLPPTSLPPVAGLQEMSGSTSESPATRPVVSVARNQLITSDPAKWSRWLVRLRRFGSNEVDVVRVSVNLADFGGSSSTIQVTRSIVFKQLEPTSGYELCVESASPNQLISDRLQILNANHYLKCRDSSSVELAELARNSTSTNGDDDDDVKLMRRLDLLPAANESTRDELELLNSGGGGDNESHRLKSLCREFLTPAQGKRETINFGSSQSEAASELLAADNSANLTLAAGQQRRPKALVGAASGALRSHVELMEVVNSRTVPTTFEMLAWSSGTRAGRSSGHLNQNGTSNSNSNSSAPPQIIGHPLDSSLMPIVACVFLLIFLATLANMLLNLIHCTADRSKRQPQVVASSNNNNNNNSKMHHHHHHQQRRRRRRHLEEAAATQSGYFSAVAGELSGRSSSSLGGSSKSRMLVGGARSPVSSAAAASVYALSSAARFPLGPSFEGDEKHNADMVGLARRNYDQFITSIYNADHLAGELSNAQLNGARTRQTNSTTERDTRRELLLQATSFKQQAKEESASSPATAFESRTVPAKQRIRFDKVNPIYNMDGLQQLVSSRTSVAQGASSPESSVGATTSTLASGQPVAAAQSPACSICESPGGATGEPSALDKQQQRFQAQQQQLERVLSKNGSLVPQPYIRLTDEHESAPEVGEKRKSFVFGDSHSPPLSSDEETPAMANDGEAAPMPAPPSPLVSASSSPTNEAPIRSSSSSLPVQKSRPLVQLQAQSARDPQPAINKSDFDQRRNELASKLHLAGMGQR